MPKNPPPYDWALEEELDELLILFMWNLFVNGPFPRGAER